MYVYLAYVCLDLVYLRALLEFLFDLGFHPDEDINTTVMPTIPAATYTGPITRAHACQLNYQVLPFLGNDANVHEKMLLLKLDTFILLTNEGPSLDKKDGHWSKIKHGDDGMRKGNKNGVTSDDSRTLKPP